MDVMRILQDIESQQRVAATENFCATVDDAFTAAIEAIGKIFPKSRDNPFGGLDGDTKQELLAIAEKIKDRGRTHAEAAASVEFAIKLRKLLSSQETA